MSDQQTVTVAEAAKRLGQSTQQVRTMCKNGHFVGAFQGPNRRWQIPVSELPDGGPAETPDSSGLAPASDDEILALFETTSTEDPDAERPGGPDPEADDTITAQEVLETLRSLRDTTSIIGEAVGSLHDGLSAIIDVLSAEEGQPAPMEDAAALEALLSGEQPRGDDGQQDLWEAAEASTPTLETLSEVCFDDEDVEIDTDPRQVWEHETTDPRDDWENDHE